MRNLALRCLGVALLAVGLSGCSGAPSDDEMASALLLAMRPMTGATATIDEIETRDCTDLGNDAYSCHVKAVLHYTVEFGGRSQEKTQPFVGYYHFVETDDGWKLNR